MRVNLCVLLFMYVRVYYANCIRLYKVIDTGSPLINIIKRIK